MAKKKPVEERKPDLNESDNQAEIEARIKEMMELDEPKQAPKPVQAASGEEAPVVTAPVLPDTPKKAVPIKIIDHNEEPEEAAQGIVAEDEEVLDAIAQANAQLAENAKSAAKLDGQEEEVLTDSATNETASAETGAEDIDSQLQEVAEADSALSAPELTPAEISDAPKEETTATEKELPKEKPLKHLDSIIPKTKTIETIESDGTDKAVADIIAKESDALLEAEDEKLAAAFVPAPKPSFTNKLRSALGSKLFRVTAVLLLVGALTATLVFPETRYFALNTAGVRSSASLKVYDESTRQPLKGVTVKLAGRAAQSDQDGNVSFTELKLGRANLIVEKRAFAGVSKSIVLGWGSNPLGEVYVTPTGTQYRFKVTDFLSGKPVHKVEAVSEDAAALSNEKGEIRLTIDQQEDREREVVIAAEGYREERFMLDLGQRDELTINLVPAKKHAFISKRSGRYDVYKVDVDGSNEKLVLPGTGSERDDMVLAHHPTEDVAALVSTKDNKRNTDGFLLSTLTVMNLAQETAKSVVTSERVQIIDWIGTRIVYVAVKEGASGDSPDRHTLVSYDYKTQEFKELAASNYFNDVLVADNKIYYAPSSAYASGSPANFYMVNADGSNQQALMNREVWNIFRVDYDKLAIASEQEWYELRLGENTVAKISGEPPNQVSRVYVDSPDGKNSLWVDSRDGKGVLLAYEVASRADDIIRTQGGLKQPVRWLNSRTVVYRVHTEAETADYVLNLEGGEPKKIRDVTNTSGINTWYYY